MPIYTPHLLHSFPSPLGALWLSASDQGLSGLWFSEQKHLPDFSDAKRWQRGQHRYMQAAIDQLTRYFAGQMTTQGKTQDFQFGAALPLDLRQGTAFQQSVWQGLLKIPMGGSTSYGALAAQIGKPAAVRAVGAAVGRNPIGILVPCHRVLGRDGSLTGYAGGLEKKVALLRLEGVLM
jgi:methylated-DNA-[protein]-cysteine S-methyltransferase